MIFYKKSLKYIYTYEFKNELIKSRQSYSLSRVINTFLSIYEYWP